MQVGERYHSDGFQAKALLVIAACVRVSIATCCYVGCGCNTCIDRDNDIVCYNSAEHGSGACEHGLTPWFCPDCRLSTADLVVDEAKVLRYSSYIHLNILRYSSKYVNNIPIKLIFLTYLSPFLTYLALFFE